MAADGAQEPVWKTVFNALQRQLNAMPLDEYGWLHVTQQSVDAFQAQTKRLSDNDERILVLGRLDVDKMIAVCRAGGCPWWPVFTARAYFGDVDGLRKVHAAFTEDAGKSDLPGMSSVMTWVSFPNTLKNEATSAIKAPVLEQLMAWGADPNFSDGKWLCNALRTLEAQCIKVFLDYGANMTIVAAELASAHRNQKNDIVRNIEEVLPGRTFMTKTGDDELMQARFFADTQGLSSLKTVFNFTSRRVTDIYTPGNAAQPVMTNASFADVDRQALEAAAQALADLGGRKDALSTALEKPFAPKRAGLAR